MNEKVNGDGEGFSTTDFDNRGAEIFATPLALSGCAEKQTLSQTEVEDFKTLEMIWRDQIYVDPHLRELVATLSLRWMEKGHGFIGKSRPTYRILRLLLINRDLGITREEILKIYYADEQFMSDLGRYSDPFKIAKRLAAMRSFSRIRMLLSKRYGGGGWEWLQYQRRQKIWLLRGRAR